MTKPDWNPESYERFGDVRLQPALDLLQSAGALPDGDIIDLGCGSGVMGAALRARFPGRRLIGVDNSPAMLSKARATRQYDTLITADVASWTPERPPALIFSNAVLQWLGDHPALLPRLAAMLDKGGVLAVQVPHQQRARSSQAWRSCFEALGGGQPDAKMSEVLEPEDYFDLLAPLGQVRVWQTEYIQHLAASETGHPVRLYTESTFARPYLEKFDSDGQAQLVAAYDREVAASYPLRQDGSVLFPFKRLFFVLET